MRGRGKEDSRAGGQDLMVLGTHLFDLMRLVAGDARWCMARVGMAGKQRVAPVTKADVRQGGEGMGRVAGDHIVALYGFDRGVVGHFASQRCTRGKGEPDRFGLTILGTRGVIQLTTGSLPPVVYLNDPSWFPGRGKSAWQTITSAGLGRPEPTKDGGLGQGNVWIADTWNGRIQKLSSEGTPILQFSVQGGWESQNVTNKPYIAVDPQGRVIASFPEQNRLSVFGSDGQKLKDIALPGNAAPVGVAVAPDGHILIADARGNVVESLPGL